ncbi:MAG TPA: class I SAM-dependent methyltransferase [Opitutaceae bacterium]|nr:class I SAM-dependent methyltransferase [Opitutaceae bacterium]
MSQISGETVREDFNDPAAVIHYARAAHFLGLWASERILLERFFPDRGARLLEAGCGAGRATIGIWDMGYHNLTAFDFAAEQLDQARSLARERAAEGIRFVLADATRLNESELGSETGAFEGALFLFNGLMQIPGRENRRTALRQLRRVCRPGAPLLFTTHDRDAGRAEQALWRLEAGRWERGEQDPRLLEFGDRYFQDEHGSTFMHLPVRTEILEDLAATGWEHTYDELRRQVATEPQSVRDFSDECRFWAARAS